MAQIGLSYNRTFTVGSITYHEFNFCYMDPLFGTLLFLLDADYPLVEQILTMFEIPIMLPSFIASGTQFDQFPFGSPWTAPDDLYFAYLFDESHWGGVYPTAPPEIDVLIENAYADNVRVVYSEGSQVTSPYDLPSDHNPIDYPPDENGWFVPPYASMGYDKKTVSFKSTSGDHDVTYKRVWIERGCGPYHPLHYMTRFDEVDWYNPNNSIHRWFSQWREDCCNEGSGLGYLIVAETYGGGSSAVLVWLFGATSTNPVRYFSPLIYIPVEAPGVLNIVRPSEEFFSALNINLELSPKGLANVHLQLAKLYAKDKNFVLGDSDQYVLGDSSAYVIGQQGA